VIGHAVCRRSSLKVLIVDGRSPVTAPVPTTIGEDAHGSIPRVQDSGVCAVAVEVGRGGLGLDRTGPIDLGIEQRVEVDGSTESVLRPVAGAWDVSAVEGRGVVVFHGQLVVGGRIVVHCADFLDRIPQFKKLFEDRDDLRRQVFVDDQVAAVGLSVEADVVDLDPAQPLRVEWAAWPPARAEVGGTDRLNRGSGWARGGRRFGGRRPRRRDGRW